MKKIFISVLILCGMFHSFGSDLQTTIARGIGNSTDAALKDALNQAIMQAAGAIVDSHTLVKNDEIIQEKVLTASNAIVKTYDVIMPAPKRSNGLFEIRIKAIVQKNLLRQTLVKKETLRVLRISGQKSSLLKKIKWI